MRVWIDLFETEQTNIPAEIYHGTSRESLTYIIEGNRILFNDDDMGTFGLFCSGDIEVAERYLEPFTPYGEEIEGDGAVICFDTAKLLSAGMTITPSTYHSGDDGTEYVISGENHPDISHYQWDNIRPFVTRIVVRAENDFEDLRRIAGQIPVVVI